MMIIKAANGKETIASQMKENDFKYMARVRFRRMSMARPLRSCPVFSMTNTSVLQHAHKQISETTAAEGNFYAQTQTRTQTQTQTHSHACYVEQREEHNPARL
jgi:hypothetical protein